MIRARRVVQRPTDGPRGRVVGALTCDNRAPGRLNQTGRSIRTRKATMKILVAVDGSRHTKRMLAYLAAHDEWLGAQHQYTVFCGVLAVPHTAASFLDKSVVKSYYDGEAEVVFKPIRTFFKKQGLSAEFVTKVGHPADLIAKLAQAGKFDLLMMGSHGHGLLGNLVLGSVATKVLAQCTTPVLLVR
jgi:nucleotide-binding universal stress UspA family protein